MIVASQRGKKPSSPGETSLICKSLIQAASTQISISAVKGLDNSSSGE